MREGAFRLNISLLQYFLILPICSLFSSYKLKLAKTWPTDHSDFGLARTEYYATYPRPHQSRFVGEGKLSRLDLGHPANLKILVVAQTFSVIFGHFKKNTYIFNNIIAKNTFIRFVFTILLLLYSNLK